jgi:hypothetical protein
MPKKTENKISKTGTGRRFWVQELWDRKENTMGTNKKNWGLL